MTDRMRIETNNTQGENWWEDAKAGGSAGLKPRDGDEGREDVVSLMRVLNGKNAHKNTIPRLLKNNSVPKSFRGISGTDEDTIRYRTQVLEVMEELEQKSSRIDAQLRLDPNNTEWKELQSKVSDITGLDADAWAAAFDADREQKAKDAAAVLAAQAAVAVNSTKAPEPAKTSAGYQWVDEDTYYRDGQIVRDLSSVVLSNGKNDIARDRLLKAKIPSTFVSERQGERIRERENFLIDLNAYNEDPSGFEHLIPNLEYAAKRYFPGLKIRKIGETALGGVTTGVQTTPIGELDVIMEVHKSTDGRILYTAQRDLLAFIKSHIRDGDYIDAVNLAKQRLEEIQNKRSQRAGAFGLTETQIREQYGIETGNSKDEELIIREIKRPVLGNEIPIDFTAGLQQFGEKRRALTDVESFSYKRTAELLADIYAAHLESYNGEVTNKSDLDTNLLGRIDGELRRKRDVLKGLYEAGMRGQKGLIFNSLIPFPDGTDPFGLAAIRQKVVDGGFATLTAIERQMIPEMKAYEELNRLLVWHDAETELIRTLQTIRSFSTAKEIDTMAALGKSPDRLVMKTSSIVSLWSLDSLDGRHVEEGESIADDTDEALRIYGLIAQTATEPVGTLSGLPWEMEMKELVREFLRGSTEIETGSKPKNSKYILNRFSMNLSPEKLTRVEAFVDYMVTNNVVSRLRRSSEADKLVLLNETKSGVRAEIDKSVATLSSGPEIRVPTIEDREKRLGIDNAVAFAHVTGLADKWSANLEYEKRKEDDPLFLPSYVDGGDVWVGKIKVGVYPACTAGAEVANYSNYIMAQFLENRLVASQVLVDELLAGGLSESLAHSFFTNTAVTEGTSVVDLWKMWWVDEQPLKKVAERMRGRLPENAIQGYFSSISNAKKLADILLGTDTSILKEVDENAKAQAKINVAIMFGLGMSYGKEKDKISSRYRAMGFAGPLIYGMGFSGQLTTSDVISAVEDTRKGLDSDEPVRKYLKRIIRDYVGSTSDDIAGLNHTQSEELRKRTSLPKIAGAMDGEAIKTFAQIVEKYHLKARKKKITQATLEAPSVLDNVIWGNTEGKIPYATIWNGLLK